MLVSPVQTLSRLYCAYKKENQTRRVECDLGNPMKGGAKVRDTHTHVLHTHRHTLDLFSVMDQVVAGLSFSVHQLSEQDTSVKFDLQIVR